MPGRPRIGLWITRLVILVAALTLAILYEAHADDAPDFAEAVDRTLETVILPAHAAFLDAAATQREAMAALCETPDEAHLGEAGARFGDLVSAFSRIEMFRFGPARTDNRFERLFFWPDRRSRGLRQVEGLIAEEDETARDVTSLRGKSVAVQGLLALDYVLAGNGSSGLIDGSADYRCRYGLAISGAILETAREVEAGWTADDGYAALMRAPGPENPVYRTHAEVIEDLLQAASEQIQILHDLKLVAVTGDAPGAAKPKRAPFWRSGLTLPSMIGNIDGVLAVHDEGLAPLLPAEHARFAQSLDFELTQARGALVRLADDSRAWIDLVADPEAHGALAYAALPLGGALSVLGDRYPPALGLTLGFNSLDGD